MKKNQIFRFMAACTALFFMTIGCNAPTSDTANKAVEATKQATAEELSQMNRDFVKALNAKDAVAAANCYTEDAMILPPNEAPVKGRANI